MLLKNKNVLIIGLATGRSIANGIAQSMADFGANVGLVCQNERMVLKNQDFASELKASFCLACDVSSDEEIAKLAKDVEASWDHVDCVVHSVAFSPKGSLGDDYLDGLDREAFRVAHDISSYSFSALAKAFKHMMLEGSSMITLSYLGAQRAIEGYNVMGLAKASLEASVRYLAFSLGSKGIRVNAISAGPIRTLSFSALKDVHGYLKIAEDMSLLSRNVSTKEVGDTATFLASSMASGITGEIIYVDAGIHVAGKMKVND